MTILKVSKISNPHAVAGAIAGLVRDHGIAAMQSIGAGATNQAIKAIAIARAFMEEEGVDLICAPSFMDVEFDGDPRTAIRFEMVDREVSDRLLSSGDATHVDDYVADEPTSV